MAKIDVAREGELPSVNLFCQSELQEQQTTRLKAGPGKHIKERYYKYVKALKTEIARIERLQMLQKQATGLIFVGLLAMLTGAGNFVWGLLSNKINYGEWFPDLRSDVRSAPASE